MIYYLYSFSIICFKIGIINSNKNYGQAAKNDEWQHKRAALITSACIQHLQIQRNHEHASIAISLIAL